VSADAALARRGTVGMSTVQPDPRCEPVHLHEIEPELERPAAAPEFAVCQACGRPLPDVGRFKPRRFCSRRCAQQTRRRAVKLHENPLPGVTHGGPISAKNSSAEISGLREALPPFPRKAPKLDRAERGSGIWVRINDVTWKLCGSGVSRVEAIGKNSGFNTPKALAWAIHVGGAWYANARKNGGSPTDDLWFGPTSLHRAREAAEAMLNSAPLERTGTARLIRGRLPINKIEAGHIDQRGNAADNAAALTESGFS